MLSTGYLLGNIPKWKQDGNGFDKANTLWSKTKTSHLCK